MMAHIRIEIDRGLGWQVRQEGDFTIAAEELRAKMSCYAVSYPHRFWLDGVLIGEIVRKGRRLVCEAR